jgi:lantibiotic modifying enzyme
MNRKVKSLLMVGLLCLSAIAAAGQKPAGRPYLEAALKAAHWVEQAAISTSDGMTRPAIPGDPKLISDNLYSGTPGVVIFFLEMHAATKDLHFLDLARKGADHLLAVYDSAKETAFYEGIAGIGFALEETYKATGDMRYREGLRKILEIIENRAVKKGRGVEWGEVTDIVNGGAGTGLFLLYASKELTENKWRDLAASAGRRLIELGTPDQGGLKWLMSSAYNYMPNFSHGTAGVSYFMARLYEVTKDKDFLRTALAGTKYLAAIAQKDTCLLYHDERPEYKDVFYLGWCHGPVGTSRLFLEMNKVTGEKSWMDWVKKSTQAIMDSGIPEKRTSGLWNNVGLCCGTAGIGDYVLELYKMTGDKAYREFALKIAVDLLSRATEGEGTLKWIHAETRRTPDVVFAQTGLMQGAAGIGLFLLHFDALETGRKIKIFFPDAPYGK